jgi:hypothetical protein
MATLVVDGDHLVVHLSLLEQVGALRGDVRVPLAAVHDVRVSDNPWSQLRGVRAPGTGWPGVIALGTRRGRGVKDFTAVYGKGEGVVVELKGGGFDRLVMSADDASAAVELIAEARRRLR